MKLSQSWYPSQVPTEIIPQNLSPGFPNLVNSIHAITLAVNPNVTLDSSSSNPHTHQQVLGPLCPVSV